ncbi:MAG: hypothetical protein NZ473_07225, partial [Candidatus Kapabacteria bacterium]|nr:hypothetical protein [Candidatus Kapabacteria bacterium]
MSTTNHAKILRFEHFLYAGSNNMVSSSGVPGASFVYSGLSHSAIAWQRGRLPRLPETQHAVFRAESVAPPLQTAPESLLSR